MNIDELDERQRTIVAMWNDGHSSGSIGRALGITRNAAIGVVHRMQVKGYATRKGLPFVSVRKVNPKLHPAIEIAQPKPAKVKPAKTKPPKEEPEVILDPAPVPLVLCDNNGCRFAVKWDRHTSRHLFCNKSSVPNKSFCETHYSVVYEKRK